MLMQNKKLNQYLRALKLTNSNTYWIDMYSELDCKIVFEKENIS